MSQRPVPSGGGGGGGGGDGGPLSVVYTAVVAVSGSQRGPEDAPRDGLQRLM